MGILNKIFGNKTQSIQEFQTNKMNEDLFWELIDKARTGYENNFDQFCSALTDLLRILTIDDIILFKNILSVKINEASNFKMLMANFIIYSYTSDNVFEDFRAWLVGQGKINFYKALQNPDNICDFLEREDTEELSGESLLFVSTNAFTEKTNRTEKEFNDLITFVNDSEFDINWPDSKMKYRDAMPRLFDKFWNQERINEIHKD